LQTEKIANAQPVKKALVIGISEYVNLPPMDFCKNDAIEVNKLLTSLGYTVSALMGEVKWEQMRDTTIHFLTDRSINHKEKLIFYFSGHCIPSDDGEIFLGSSEIDPDIPWLRGLSFGEFSKLTERSSSELITVILDSNYSGALKLGDNSSLLASCLPIQESYMAMNKKHSLFTYYLLEGLKGREESIDIEGNVTPRSLANYVYKKMSSAKDKVKQTPIARIGTALDDALAHYPELTKGEYKYKLLRDGKILEFNNIRKQHRFGLLDLHRVYLMEASLSGADFHRADLMDSNLIKADLSGADMRGSDLRGATLSQADLSGADMRGSDLRGATLIKAKAARSNFSGTLLQRANLSGINLFGSYLVTNLVGILLEDSDLRSAYLNGADLRFAQLARADLRETDLKGANLNGADLRETDLRGALNLPFSKEEAMLKGAIT
jgi:uncharacterized protein YjbI with pentapeptide repeats